MVDLQAQVSAHSRPPETGHKTLMMCVCVCVLATSKQLKVFDGDDAMKRGCFRLVSIMRAIKNEEVVVRAFHTQ